MLRISYNEHRAMSKFSFSGIRIPIPPTNNTYFKCRECMCSDGLIIADAPHVIECIECGHPNDVTWDNDECDIFSE